MTMKSVSVVLAVLFLAGAVFADDVEYMVGGRSYKLVVGYGPTGPGLTLFSSVAEFRTEAPTLLRSPVDGVVLISTKASARPPRMRQTRRASRPACGPFSYDPDCFSRSFPSSPGIDGFSLMAIRTGEGDVLLIYNVDSDGFHEGDSIRRGETIGMLSTSAADRVGYFQLGLLRRDGVISAEDLQFLLWSDDQSGVRAMPSPELRRYDPAALLSFASG